LTRDTRIQLGAALVMALCLASSAVLALDLTSIAGRAKLTFTDRPEEGQPPEVSLGIAMGAFRGIFVNFLWMRANDMKEAGKFYEAIELASAITRLQPRFPRVWVFHAWNMAYNISVSTQTREERWNWVNAGIALLRDKGIPANPNDMLLHKELGWIFLHKVGGYTDDANTYYKRRLATEWTIVLGPPPPRTADDRDRDKAIKKYADWLRIVADAPDTLATVVKAEPSVTVLVERLKNETGHKLNQALLAQYESIRALHRSSQRAVFESTFERVYGRPMGAHTVALGRLIEDPQFAAAWANLIPFIRKQVLVETYHMEPARMIRYTEMFGPIDWRHHAAHSLYWSHRGVDGGLTRWTEANKRDYDFINTDRIVVQSIQDLFRSGEMYFDFFAETTGRYSMFIGVPNPHFIKGYADIVEDVRRRSWADDAGARGTTPLSGGYENFLRDAVTFFYRRGELDTAEYWRNRLATYKYLNLGNPFRAEELAMPMKEFVEHELETRLTSPSVALSQISAALMGAFSSGLLARDTDLFLSQFEFAKKVHRFFLEEQLRTSSVNRESGRMEQFPPDFRFFSGQLFFQFTTALSIEDAEQVYDRAPNDLKLFAYGPIVERFKEELDAQAKAGVGRAFASVFPEPQGWREFQLEIQQIMEEQSKQGPGLEQK